MPAPVSVQAKPDPIAECPDATRSPRPLPDKVKALLDDLHHSEATADRSRHEAGGLRRLGSIVPALREK